MSSKRIKETIILLELNSLWGFTTCQRRPSPLTSRFMFRGNFHIKFCTSGRPTVAQRVNPSLTLHPSTTDHEAGQAGRIALQVLVWSDWDSNKSHHIQSRPLDRQRNKSKSKQMALMS